MTKQLGLLDGHAAAERAADHAGELWKDLAYRAFKQHACSHAIFITEDVHIANPDLPPPPDKRAWGQIALRAKREGIVKHGGYTNAKLRHVHGTPTSQWISQCLDQ